MQYHKVHESGKRSKGCICRGEGWLKPDDEANSSGAAMTGSSY